MIYESGKESKYIDDITQGRKTFEGRLDRGKFSDYRVGDFIWLRRDIRVAGKLVDGKPHQLLVKVVSITKFPTFRALLTTIGYEKVIPEAQSLDAAALVYANIYPEPDELACGVLAIGISVADESELPKEEYRT